MSLLAALAVGCGGCTATSVAVPGTPTKSTSLEDQTRRSSALLDQSLAPDEPGCSAAAAVDGEVVWTDVRGLADLGSGTPLTPSTRFDFGSVANQFTGAIVLLLAQEGRLALTDPVSTHVSGMPEWADEVTVADLLHHTSGIPEVIGVLVSAGHSFETPTTTADALGAIAGETELGFDPGTVWEYSNSNYVLLAEIARSASGQDLVDLLDERIFGPLGLDMAVRSDRGGDVAIGYSDLFGEFKQTYPAWLVPGPGFIVTTPSELVRWADNYRTGAVGGPPLLEGMTLNAAPTSSAPDAPRYGAGIARNADGSLWHDGEWGGHISYLAVSPDRHTAVAIGCNHEDWDKVENLRAALQNVWFATG